MVFQFSEWSFRTISPWKHNLYLLLDQVNSKHPYSALDICFVLLLTLREGWGYWIGWIFGKIPNGLPPLPPPSFLENYIAIFYDRYGCIYARRCDGQIVWNACTWFPESGTILIYRKRIHREVGKNIFWKIFGIICILQDAGGEVRRSQGATMRYCSPLPTYLQ